MRSLRCCLALGLLASLAGCGPKYSPNTYSSAAVQQANKVDRGVIIGARRVDVAAPGVVGAATGGAAGGIAGSQVGGSGTASAFGALGGALIGGLVGTGVEHVAEDTFAYEYIVKKPNGDLVSVTQKDRVPLHIGENVLVISGSQARIVPDYTQPSPPPPAPKPVPPPPPPALPTQTAPPPAAVSATPLAPLPPLPAFTPAP
jgi:outer membrane lipoprotein SlyB